MICVAVPDQLALTGGWGEGDKARGAGEAFQGVWGVRQVQWEGTSCCDLKHVERVSMEQSTCRELMELV